MRTTSKGLIILLVLSTSLLVGATDVRQAIPVPAPDSLLLVLSGLAMLVGGLRWKKSGL